MVPLAEVPGSFQEILLALPGLCYKDSRQNDSRTDRRAGDQPFAEATKIYTGSGVDWNMEFSVYREMCVNQ